MHVWGSGLFEFSVWYFVNYLHGFKTLLKGFSNRSSVTLLHYLVEFIAELQLLALRERFDMGVHLISQFAGACNPKAEFVIGSVCLRHVT